MPNTGALYCCLHPAHLQTAAQWWIPSRITRYRIAYLVYEILFTFDRIVRAFAVPCSGVFMLPVTVRRARRACVPSSPPTQELVLQRESS